MPIASLSELPTELLYRIWYFLDWDRSSKSTAFRPDLFSVSLTSKALRQTVTPLLFQNVVLQLYWDQGALIEPGLYRLRRRCPELAKHIRCVHIKTNFSPLLRANLDAFIVPDDVADWQTLTQGPSIPSKHDVSVLGKHRSRVDSITRQLFDLWPTPCDGPDSATRSAEELIRVMYLSSLSEDQDAQFPSRLKNLGQTASTSRSTQSRAAMASNSDWQEPILKRQLRRQLDALASVFLCLPPTVRELIFEACPFDRVEHNSRYRVALQMLATACNIFCDRLEAVTLISNRRTDVSESLISRSALYNTVSDEIISNLRSLKRLILSGRHEEPSSFGETFSHERYACWARHGSYLTDLHLRNLVIPLKDLGEGADIVSFIESFPGLRRLAFEHVLLTMDPYRLLDPSAVSEEENIKSWLVLLLAIRRARPGLLLTLSSLAYRWRERQFLPVSAVRWLKIQAVPIETVIDWDREERLLEDFISFQPLWHAEDGERGREAARDKSRAMLVDTAMANRGRQYRNISPATDSDDDHW